MHPNDIRITKPRLDCVYCELHHFVEFGTGQYVSSQYAMCRNPIKTFGMTCIDITFDGNPLLAEVTCRNCKHYENSLQLELFD